MKTVSTTKCRPLVEAREPFRTNGDFNGKPRVHGAWQDFRDGTRVYIVWTYQEPLFIYDEASDQWFGNDHRYSVTSSKHRSQCVPLGREIEWRGRATMREIAWNGLVGAVRKQFKEAA